MMYLELDHKGNKLLWLVKEATLEGRGKAWCSVSERSIRSIYWLFLDARALHTYALDGSSPHVHSVLCDSGAGEGQRRHLSVAPGRQSVTAEPLIHSPLQRSNPPSPKPRGLRRTINHHRPQMQPTWAVEECCQDRHGRHFSWVNALILLLSNEIPWTHGNNPLLETWWEMLWRPPVHEQTLASDVGPLPAGIKADPGVFISHTSLSKPSSTTNQKHKDVSGLPLDL